MHEALKDYVDRKIAESDRAMHEFKDRGDNLQAAHCKGAMDAYQEIRKWIENE